jgi:hypothetical protein
MERRDQETYGVGKRATCKAKNATPQLDRRRKAADKDASLSENVARAEAGISDDVLVQRHETASKALAEAVAAKPVPSSIITRPASPI